MIINMEPKPLPEKECPNCGLIGGLTQVGVDADQHDLPVVECANCGSTNVLDKEGNE